MLVQPVSFGATTKSGNQYKKTHVGTIAGATAGALYAAYDLSKTMKMLKAGKAKKLLRALVEMRNNIMKSGCSKEAATKFTSRYAKSSIGAAAAVLVLAGLGLGAAVNKVINKHRAEKADAQ